MSDKTPKTDKDAWADREWSQADFDRTQSPEALPGAVREAFPRTRGPQKAPTKVPVSIRLSADVVAHFKAGGPGWQRRIDETLKKIIAEQ